MTGTRRTAAPPRAVPLAAVLVLVALLAGACGAATGSPGPATGSPGSSDAAGSPGTDGGAEPSPTPWPGGTIEAVMNLAKADAQIQAAGADLSAAADEQDLKAMWGAADGLVTLLEKLTFEVSRLKDYPATQPAAAAYDAAFPDMIEGGKQVRDSITSGDAAGLTAGSEKLAKGLQAYAEARRLIGPLADQALLMQRLLTK